MITGISSAVRTAFASDLYTRLTNGVAGSNIHLFKNDFVPNPQSALGDFVECDFVGYAVVLRITEWAFSFVPELGVNRVSLNLVAHFVAGAIVAPQTAFGFYVTKNDNTVLQGFGRFNDPVIFSVNGDDLPVLPEWLVALDTMVAEVGNEL